MNQLNLKTIFSGLIILLYGCTGHSGLFVEFSNPNIDYSGRIDTFTNKAADLYWSGTSIHLNFEGTSIEVLMQDSKGDNYYNVILDKDSVLLFRPDTVNRFYPLFSGLSEEKHHIELFKRTEWDRGKTSFYGFKINGNARLLKADEPKKRKIEFYGNSITAGYAVEDLSGKDRPDSIFTNNYLSYAAITARHFDAEYSCICKSGIGILISWFPLTMPQMYNRLVPEDSISRWNFESFIPDLVVINLFQNDSWLIHMPEYPTFKKQFGKVAPTEETLINAYSCFVQSIRKEYPNAYIICALGNMDITNDNSPWPQYIDKAVTDLKDSKILTFFMPYKNTPGHPTIAEQKVMADSLVHFIEEHIQW